MSQPLSESTDNKTNEVEYSKIPDNTFTIILKAGGKVYAIGGEIGKIETDTPDEDLNSTLRAVNGAGITLQRTLAVKVAGREPTYKLPGDNVEEDLTPPTEEVAEKTAVLKFKVNGHTFSTITELKGVGTPQALADSIENLKADSIKAAQALESLAALVEKKKTKK